MIHLYVAWRMGPGLVGVVHSVALCMLWTVGVTIRVKWLYLLNVCWRLVSHCIFITCSFLFGEGGIGGSLSTNGDSDGVMILNRKLVVVIIWDIGGGLEYILLVDRGGRLFGWWYCYLVWVWS